VEYIHGDPQWIAAPMPDGTVTGRSDSCDCAPTAACADIAADCSPIRARRDFRPMRLRQVFY